MNKWSCLHCKSLNPEFSYECHNCKKIPKITFNYEVIENTLLRLSRRNTVKPGDKVISDLDGLEYTVVKFGPRDEIEPLPGVVLVGNYAVVEDDKGSRQLLYEWEFSTVPGPIEISLVELLKESLVGKTILKFQHDDEPLKIPRKVIDIGVKMDTYEDDEPLMWIKVENEENLQDEERHTYGNNRMWAFLDEKITIK